MTSKIFREHQYIVLESGAAPASTDKQNTVTPELFTVEHFTGSAFSQRGYVAGDFSLLDEEYPAVEELVDAMGEWVGVGKRDLPDSQEFIVFSDAFGYGSVFYSFLDEGTIAVSDSFHGVAAALKDAGIPPTVNLPNYVATLASPMSQFNNAYSTQTMVNEINLLRADEYIHISSMSGVTFRKRTELRKSPRQRNFTSAIRDGIELASAVFEALVCEPSLNRRITLSGGVDSRMVLAMLVSTGHHRSFTVHSVDPRTWTNKHTQHTIERDIELANLIREQYEMRWWNQGPRKAVATSFRESLEAYQSYRSNLYYQFRPSRMLVTQEFLTATLRGGGGEVLSSTANGLRLERLYQSSGSQEAPENWLGRHLTKSSELTSEFKPLIRTYLSDTYKDFQVGSVHQSLDSHYFHTRNRAHFGHLRHSLASNDLTVHALSNPYLLEASEMLPFREREEGELVRSIFLEAEPSLLNYPFENQEWSQKLSGAVPDVERIGRGKWMKDYDETHERPVEIVYPAGRDVSLDFSDSHADFEAITDNYIRSTFSLIEEVLPSSVAQSLREQHALVISRVSHGRLNPYQVIAKAASLLDGFFPQPIRGAKLHRKCRNGSRAGSALKSGLVINQLAVTLDNSKDIPILEHAPYIEISGEHLIVCSNVTSAYDSNFEYAFYLMKDGKRVAQSWYSTSPYAEFEREFGAGEYYGVSHIRYKGRKTPTFYAKTNVTSVND